MHWLKQFLYKEMLGFTKNNELFSGIVREKMIAMEEALTRLCEANKLPEAFLAEFVAWHEIHPTSRGLFPVAKSKRKQITRRYT